jgi:hypothetical protein
MFLFFFLFPNTQTTFVAAKNIVKALCELGEFRRP